MRRIHDGSVQFPGMNAGERGYEAPEAAQCEQQGVDEGIGAVANVFSDARERRDERAPLTDSRHPRYPLVAPAACRPMAPHSSWAGCSRRFSDTILPGGRGRTACHPRRDRHARAFFEAAVAAGSYPIATACGAATVTASTRGASLVSTAVLYQPCPG